MIKVEIPPARAVSPSSQLVRLVSNEAPSYFRFLSRLKLFTRPLTPGSGSVRAISPWLSTASWVIYVCNGSFMLSCWESYVPCSPWWLVSLSGIRRTFCCLVHTCVIFLKVAILYCLYLLLVQSIGASIVHFVIKARKLVQMIVSMCRVQG